MLNIYKKTGNSLTDLAMNNIVPGAWINLIAPTIDELNTVSAVTGIPIDVLKASLDEEERSRTEIEDDYVLVITNLPMMRGKNIYDTLPLGIVITTHYFITICLENNPVLMDFCPENARLFNMAKKTRFLFQILYKSAIFYLKYVREIIRSAEQIEKHLKKSMKNQELFDLMELQKGLTYFATSLRSNGMVMEKLLRLRSNSNFQHLIAMYDEDEDLLEDVIIENKQAIEMVEMYSHILRGTMDTFASIISNNLNIVMKFLASMTIILAIPTMISSFWGMNVNVPFGQVAMDAHESGFIFVIIIAGCAMGSTALLLWRKKML